MYIGRKKNQLNIYLHVNKNILPFLYYQTFTKSFNLLKKYSDTMYYSD